MKKHLLTIGTLLVAALFMAACSDSNDPDPNPNPPTPEPEPEVLYLVNKIADKAEGGDTYTFVYNDDYTLSKVTRSGGNTGSYEFKYDNGKLVETTYYDGSVNKFSYNGNTVTVQGDEFETVLEVDNAGRLLKATIELDFDMAILYEFGHDSKSRVVKVSSGTSFDGEEPDYWDVFSTYEYDDKNAIVYSEILPEWYYFISVIPSTLVPILPYAIHLTPENNIKAAISGGDEAFGGRVDYTMEYNEAGYPTLWGLTSAEGGVVEATAMTISYTEIELDEEE